MSNAQEVFKKCSPSFRLYISTNLHIKEALLNIVHNKIKDPLVKAIPDDPAALYLFLQNSKNKIQKSSFLKTKQKSILLPTNCQSVDSASLDITLIRYLIQTFCGIKNANNDWREPAQNDHTLCAYVYRAADFRNQICHNNDVDKLNATEFEKKWKELKEILQGLKYAEDIQPFKTETLDLKKHEHVIFEEFVGHLRSYKEECLKEPVQEDYVQRRFHVDGNKSDIVIGSDLENTIKHNDCVMIHAEAGMGKSSTARRIRNKWCNQNILDGLDLLYFDSKKMNKRLTVQSHAAPLYFSKLGDYLKKNGRTEDDLSIYSCVKTTFKKLIILIDGIDEFPVRDLITRNYVDELEKKVKNNEKINAADTIVAIYSGFLFPNTKICLLGRNNEFERLKEFISYKTNRGIKDLQLLEFDDANVQEFTCLNICKQQSNGQRNCAGTCKDIYEKIKKIELCKTPTDLNSLIKLHKQHPNENIGRITRTKLIIATILNRLNEHVKQNSYFKCETFGNIRIQRDKINFLECIRTIREISFKSLLKDNVTVQVNEIRDSNGIVYFKYENQISIERENLEELDLFYVRDFNYYSILEPYHTLNIEFLSACYLLSHPEKWESILKLKKDRQLVIISFIAGLHADDYFTKDFVLNVLDASSYSLEQFFSWLYDVKDVRESLPDGGGYYNRWFGLMETQKLSPSFYLLDYISHEVEIPQTYIPKTIVCYCNWDYVSSSFEWYDMNSSKHNFLTKLSDELNVELFLDKFPQYDFIIKGKIWIYNNNQFNLLNKFGNNNRITFRINRLNIYTSLNTSFSCNFNVNRLYIWSKCDSRTIDIILNALSPPNANTSSSNPQPAINCKQLYIYDISKLFNSQQTEKLFKLGLSGVVDYIELGLDIFSDGQLTILKNAERKVNKMLDIVLEEFNQMIGLPNQANRHVSLNDAKVNVVTDNDLIKLREHIPPGYANNLTNFDNYKIIHPAVPFVRKENFSHDRKQSMFLNLCAVSFTEVSPDVFVETFSLIPSISCDDSLRYKDGSIPIPSSHWSRLSKINNCRLNEMRIWRPRPENFEHFLNIKTNLFQLVSESKDKLKGLLNHIVNNPNIQLDKQIKVFVVKYDNNDWDYYAEVPVFSDKTIEEYRINYCSYELLLDNISEPFHEGELHLNWWCCEISLPIKENIDSVAIVSDDEFTSSCCSCC